MTPTRVQKGNGEITSGNCDYSEIGACFFRQAGELQWAIGELYSTEAQLPQTEETRTKLSELLLLQGELDSIVHVVHSMENKLPPRGEPALYQLAWDNLKPRLERGEHEVVQEQGTVEWALLEMVRQLLARLRSNDPRLGRVHELLRHCAGLTPTRMWILVFREFAALVASANQQRSQQPMQGVVPSHPTTPLSHVPTPNEHLLI